MVSTLFFLICVLPSIWIMCLNETNLKAKFQEEASKHENEIKNFVMSLDLTGESRLFNNRPNAFDTATIAYPEDLLWQNIIPKSYEDITRKTPLHKARSDIDCCVVKVSYWFQEDVWQRVYFQLFLSAIILSRWLITQSGLKIIHRLLKMLVSLLVAIDMLFFFNLVLIESVYIDQVLLYAILSVTSVSALQFVFLFIDETLYPMGMGPHLLRPSQMSYNDLVSEYHVGDIEDDSAFMYDNNMMKNSRGLSHFLFGNYLVLKTYKCNAGSIHDLT